MLTQTGTFVKGITSVKCTLLFDFSCLSFQNPHNKMLRLFLKNKLVFTKLNIFS